MDLDSSEGAYKVDIYGIHRLFAMLCALVYYNTNKDYDEITFDIDNDVYFGYLCFGQYGRIPMAEELLKHDYFNKINMPKLLLREYDLEKELEIDCLTLFNKYNKLNQWTEYEKNLVFYAETKSTFLRKDDVGFFKPVAELFTNV